MPHARAALLLAAVAAALLRPGESVSPVPSVLELLHAFP
jgi:hypothetical protein